VAGECETPFHAVTEPPEATCEDLCWMGLWWIANPDEQDGFPPCPRCGRAGGRAATRPPGRWRVLWPCGHGLTVNSTPEPKETTPCT